jgi:hypothetical protein
MGNFAKELEKQLKPLYLNLIEDVKNIQGPKYTFAVQWGKSYPTNNNEGIIFVGRATNTWGEPEENPDIEKIFGLDEKYAIFNLPDQMTWVNRDWDTYSHKSAFWRVIRRVSQYYHPVNENNPCNDLEHVAWSNICKIQKDSGKNPSGRIFDNQIVRCQEIFKVELDTLSPKFVVMFVGNFGKREILSYLNGGDMPTMIERVPWNSNNVNGYNICVYKIDSTIFLCTEHPQGKDESSHVKCLISLINKYSK